MSTIFSGQLTGQFNKQTSVSVSPESDIQAQAKRFHQSDPEYFDISPYIASVSNSNLNALNTLTAMSINFPQIPSVLAVISCSPWAHYSILSFWEQLMATPYATSFRRRFFAYHKAMRHPHTNIILSLFSIPLVLKCAAKILKID